MNIDLKYIFFGHALALEKEYLCSFEHFLVGQMHVLHEACFGGRILRRTVSIDQKSGCVITSVPNVSYKRKILPLQRV
jgi:hypothetical protein